ncbi:50S ribosomal protein L35 [Actibacterium mucosum KCTC 23349]|uniref:50S ribosomal protein L35 n=1 Tax=Actibacterium mucosum KCTC 23349 TaxID=1454373 RepID=A0A037ZH36_9RHOB|nr:hypothetical protein [Actibacterium mucosum]KAJ54852.1 50S ribosomal protein L35 [Actibacterium mucosum KCTC 23349]
MSTDIYLVVGTICGVLAFPSLLGAYSEGRPPRAAAILILIAGGLIVLALYQSPQSISLEDIPNAFVRVFSRLLS